MDEVTVHDLEIGKCGSVFTKLVASSRILAVEETQLSLLILLLMLLLFYDWLAEGFWLRSCHGV